MKLINPHIDESKYEREILQLLNVEDIFIEPREYFDIVSEIIFANPLISVSYRQRCENNIMEESISVTVIILVLFFVYFLK